MCGKDSSLSIEHVIHDVHKQLFVLTINRGGGFVKDIDLGWFEKGSRNCNSLLLSATELVTKLADLTIVAVW
jgi:hypothetical protein